MARTGPRFSVMIFRRFMVFLLFAGSTLSAQVSFVFNYDFDDAGFFSGANEGRRAALQAAGDYVAGLIAPSTFAAITPNETDSWIGRVRDPRDVSQEVEVGNVTIPANTIQVYVGGSVLSESYLAYGGIGAGWAPFESTPEWAATLYFRGNEPYYRYAIGSITFSSTTAWYFDDDISSVEPMGGAYDFFSTAIHELFHVLGSNLHGAPNWSALVDSEGRFIGANAMAVYGGPVPLDAEHDHWANGTQSLILGTSIVQDPLMDPYGAANERIYATALDVAALRDLGYATVAVPEPAAYAGCLGLVVLLVVIRRQRFRRR